MAQRPAPEDQAIRVLLVEDNRVNAQLIHALLARVGEPRFSLECVGRLATALERLGEDGIDAVLLDLGLPDSEGLDTFAKVNAYAPDIPIVIVSGMDDALIAARAVREGAQDYLVKGQPGFGYELVRTVRYAIERKRAEAALRRSEADYRSIIENAPYGIYRSTPEGSFLMANPAMLELLGYDTETELLSVDVARDVYVDPGQRTRLMMEYLGSETIRGVEAEWKRKDGTPIAVRLSGRPVQNEAGELEYFEMSAEDVTEQKQLQAQLRQAQKMEAVGQLTGGIAHDFNNLLTVIMGNTDLVVDSLPAELEYLRNDLEEIQAAAQHGSTLIKRLLGFSRHDSLELKPTNLSQLVTELVTVLRRVVPETVEIRLEAARRVGTVQVDRAAVEQMVLNLATNARDAMPDGGMLSIDVEQSWLDEGYLATHPWCHTGEYAALVVKDTGVGMDEETKERIFEPFFTTKPAEIGTGLGMAMTYGLMKQHRGFVHVYSEVGQGTVVKLLFPLTTEDVRRYSRDLTPVELPVGQETILVVEDELAIRRATRRALESHGYTVLLASDGEEGLEVFRTHRSEIHLVIADMVMPKLGGRQFYEALCAEGNSVSVMFCSGYSARDVSPGTALPADVPFLPKPWTLSELLVGVRQVLDQAPVGRKSLRLVWGEQVS